jgi:hypothetical protein
MNCARCCKERRLHARGLCRNCYSTCARNGTLQQYAAHLQLWSAEDLAYLRANAHLPTLQLAAALQRTKSAVESRKRYYRMTRRRCIPAELQRKYRSMRAHNAATLIGCHVSTVRKWRRLDGRATRLYHT